MAMAMLRVALLRHWPLISMLSRARPRRTERGQALKRVFQTISVVGLGYIGLPTAAMFASRKIKVVGVDVNEQTVETINAGRVHIVEPDLDIAVRAVVEAGYLRATTTPEPAEAFLIAVPTPFLDGHQPD